MKQLFFFLVLINFSNLVQAQESRIDSLLNAYLFDGEDLDDMMVYSGKYQFLYSRMSYDSQTYFAGRDIGIEQYNLTGQLSWFHHSGFSLGAAAVYYSALDPKISTALLMAGYSGRFTKSSDYRYRLSYDRFFFPGSDLLAASSFNSSLSGGITIDKKVAGTRLDYSLLMGKEYGSQVSWDIYGDFKVLRLGKLNRVKFEPEVSVYLGSDKTIITQVGVVPGRFPVKYETTEVESEKFGWMNTELKLPVTISLGNFDFELGYNMNFPRSVATTEKLEVTSYFNFSIGYLLVL